MSWSSHQHERATAHVLGATFGRADLEHVANGRLLFVRCPRAYLVGDLPIPRRPDRLVIEVNDAVTVDSAVLSGIRRLREEGFRVAVPAFVSNPNQRRLLPHADFVKIDVRDLDVEGPPVVHLARSYGALLVAEYVETRTRCATRATSGSRSSRATCSSAPACSTAQALAASASSRSADVPRHSPLLQSGERRHESAPRRSHPV